MIVMGWLIGCGSGGSNEHNAGGSSGTGGSGTGGNGTGGNGTAGATTGGTSAGGAGATRTRLADTATYYQDVSQAALDPESATLLGALEAAGWADAGRRLDLGVDFSFEIGVADPSVARRTFDQPSGALPDCDTAPIPVIPGGSIEGSSNYECSGDCHLIVYQGTRLYELYLANITGGQAVGGTFTGECLVVWDLTRDYWQPTAPPNFSRGDGCNGADASDMPIAPLLLTREELAAGEVTHAMRFTISNNRIQAGVYVHPATHIGGPTGGTDMLPYGARLRLRGDYDLTSLPNDAARTVARALQKYGMFLADGGNIYISATTNASDVIGGSDMGALRPSDFEMVDGGQRLVWSDYNCSRTPVTN
jgi:serine/threonine-protein kinase